MFSAAYKRYVLFMLTLVCTLGFLDSGLLALLLQPIKEDLGLSDTQLGLMTGIAGALFYAALGLPISRWADRGNRTTITSLAIGLWGIVVMLYVFVTSFAQLLTLRMAVAVGDAGLKPPSYSLLGDYFPEPAEGTVAMAIFWSAGSLSALLSFAVGGWLNELYGWRLTMLLMGLPGVVVAVLIKLTVIEPRTLGKQASGPQQRLLPMASVLLTLWRQPSTRHLGIALMLLQMMTVGLTPWFAAFMIRSHGMNTAELGVWLGLIAGFGGLAGALLGGYVSGRWFAHDERGQMRLSARMVGSLVPCSAVFLLVPHKLQALAALIPFMVMLSFFTGPTFALLQRLVVEEMRATSFALIMLLGTLVGVGIGPLLVGVLSDALLPLLGGESLRYAMLTTSVVALWSAYYFWQAGHKVELDLQAVAARAQVDVGSSTTLPTHRAGVLAVNEE